MRYEIRNRWTNACLWAAELPEDTPEWGRTRLAAEKAVADGADLRGADLGGADLGGADLRGADLGGADLGGADLGGAVVLDKIQIGPIGSRRATLTLLRTDGGVCALTGCFRGTLAELEAAIATTHGDSKHGRMYRAAIVLAGTIWLEPEKESPDAR